jgi:uncharacterized repeat protein (TIGR01451 family)
LILAAVASSLTASPSGAATSQADLSIFKTSAPEPVTVGDELTYTLHVANAGPDAASNAVATDFLPPEVSFVSASPGCTHAAGTVTCSLGSIPSGSGVTVQIVVRPTAHGTISNTARVSSDTADAHPNNNVATRNASVAQVATRLVARPLVLDVLPTVIVRFGTAEAKLTDAQTGSPLAGELIIFNSGSTELCRAQTDAAGVARCVVPLVPNLLIAVANLGYRARFEGTARYAASRDNAPVVRVNGVVGN